MTQQERYDETTKAFETLDKGGIWGIVFRLIFG